MFCRNRNEPVETALNVREPGETGTQIRDFASDRSFDLPLDHLNQFSRRSGLGIERDDEAPTGRCRQRRAEGFDLSHAGLRSGLFQMFEHSRFV